MLRDKAERRLKMKKVFLTIFIVLFAIPIIQLRIYAAEPGKNTWEYLAAHPVEKPIYNWRLQSFSSSEIYDVWHKAFAEDLGKKTGGRIICTPYKTGALFAPNKIIHAVRDGAIEIGIDYGSYHAGLIPIGNFLAGLPFSFTTTEQYNEFWWDWKGKLIPKLINQEAYEPKNIHYLGTIGMDNCMYGNFNIIKAEDLKGKKLAFFGPYADMVMQFGATPVNIPGPERYEALQRGTIDGGQYPAMSFIQYKAIEVSKFFYMPPFGIIGACCVYVNYPVWKNLSPALQDAVYWACRETAFNWDKYWKEKLHGPALKEIARRATIITFPDAEVEKLRQAAKKSWEKYAGKSETSKKIYNLILDYGK
jgi:TRAP-type C4-dicarboxylate transport system substrate-binding protein